jgi:RNA recognition motif-containing protein
MSVKLYVGNLPFNTTEQELADLFAQAGKVQSVQLINDKMTGRPRGFGFVTMESDEAGKAAATKMNGVDFNGRPLTVNEARPMEARENRGPRSRRGENVS